MLDFSSISSSLQISIAEKIEFFDQIEFEVSSKCGKSAVYAAKHRAVIELAEITTGSWDAALVLKDDRSVNCENLCKLAYLPRFKVSIIELNSDDSLDSLEEMCERNCFVENEVHLDWSLKRGASDVSGLSDVLFEFFNITSANFDGCSPREDVFSLRKVCEIPMITLNSGKISNDNLLKLQSNQIALYNQEESRISTTANLFFTQWFAKTRNLKWFHCRTNLHQRKDINKEMLFYGLPYSIIWKFNKKDSFLQFLKEPGHPEFVKYLDLNEETLVYSVDRGEKKLLVIVDKDDDYQNIYAHEYSELDDLVWMPMEERHKIDFSSIDLYLRTQIEEKIEYYDRKEFELSSKCGKDIMSRTKDTAVQLSQIANNVHHITLKSKLTDNGMNYHWNCYRIYQCTQLPRFVVKVFYFNRYDVGFDPFLELCKRNIFVPCDVYVSLRFMNWGAELFSLFSKFFDIISIHVEEDRLINEELFSLAKFCEIKIVSLSGEISDDNLLRLRSENISLDNQKRNRSPVTTNLFFKQWFCGTRNIKWFSCRTEDHGPLRCFKEDILFSGLPYEIVWKYNANRRRPELTLVKPQEFNTKKMSFELEKDHLVYSINSGDKKLLVLVRIDGCRWNDLLIALEYTRIEIDASSDYVIRVV